MKLPENVIIPDAKLTKYLLILRQDDDKSKFLAQAGFTQANPEKLKNAIIELITNYQAKEDTSNQYGIFYQVTGTLKGLNNRNLAVITIWLKRQIDNQIQFITLKPNKEKKAMIELYQRVSLNQNFPEYHLKKGDIATLIDTVPHPTGGEEGYVLEIFNAVGESINVVIVPCSAVKPLKQDEILTVRSLIEV